MSAIDNAQPGTVERLLALFPIGHLRETWNYKGSKEELCKQVADIGDNEKILGFVDEYFSCCKQHIHVYSRDANITQPPRALLPGVERAVHVRGDHALYIVNSSYRVIFTDDLERAELAFLWPVRVDLLFDNLIVRFVTLQKDLRTYFDRPLLVNGRTVDESDVLSNVELLDVTATDIHKGIKRLWHADFMDATRAKYKKPKSTAWEAMDEAKGIKAENPTLYEELRRAHLEETHFLVPEAKGKSVSALTANPSIGYVAFTRYSKGKGDTDFVINEILKHNQ